METNKTTCIRGLSALMLTLWCVMTVRAGTITYTVRYDATKIKVSETTIRGSEYVKVCYDELYNWVLKQGEPDLPAELLSFSIPYNASSIRITTIPTKERIEEIPLDKPVTPVIQSKFIESAIEQYNLESYEEYISNSLDTYPSKNAEIIVLPSSVKAIQLPKG